MTTKISKTKLMNQKIHSNRIIKVKNKRMMILIRLLKNKKKKKNKKKSLIQMMKQSWKNLVWDEIITKMSKLFTMQGKRQNKQLRSKLY